MVGGGGGGGGTTPRGINYCNCSKFLLCKKKITHGTVWPDLVNYSSERKGWEF